MGLKIILNDNTAKKISLETSIRSSSPIGERLIDVDYIAKSIFLLEDALQENEVKKIIIPVYGDYSENLNNTLERLIYFLFIKYVKVEFVENAQKRLVSITDEIKGNYTCLFSGGLDSYSGILNSKNHYENLLGVYVSHADQRHYINLIHKLEKLFLSGHGIRIKIIDSFENKKYTRLTRGFLYLLSSLLAKNRNIVVSEIGPTMYQPKFTLLDNVTFTTHPKVLYFAKCAAEEILDEQIHIYKPYENLTKSEAAQISPDKKGIRITCSCRTTRFCNSRTPNDGTCYSCIIRKLSLLVAGIDDCLYKTDALEKNKNNSTQYGNILPFLNFSLDFLDDPESLPWYTTNLITKYKKEKIFRRSSMDMLAGLFILRKTERLKDPILNKFLDNALLKVSKEELDNRIGEVRSSIFKPDFKNSI